MPAPARVELFVEYLEERQRKEGWNDRELAKKIGCSTSMWNAVRNGRRTPGRAVLDGIFRTFPELQIAYALELRKSAQPTAV